MSESDAAARVTRNAERGVNPARLASLRAGSRATSLFVVVVGSLVLLGWQLGVAELTSLLPGRIAMNPLTALGFILAGASLWLLQEGSDEPGRRTRASSSPSVRSPCSSTASAPTSGSTR